MVYPVLLHTLVIKNTILEFRDIIFYGKYRTIMKNTKKFFKTKMGENPIPQNGKNFIIGRNAMDTNDSCHAIYLDLDWERLERYYI